MTVLLRLPEALEAAGINVRTLKGWDQPYREGYVWRESTGDPAAHMHHHTASEAYTPNRDKANGWAGLSADGSTRLYQEDYGDASMEPVYVVANAWPAPISSGYGDLDVLKAIRAGQEVNGRPGPDGPEGWAGNTHYWNTEWVLNGTGAPIDLRVWEMMVRVSWVIQTLMGWDSHIHNLAHAHHTTRKIDLYGGQFVDFQDTLRQLRDAIEEAEDMTYRGVLNVPDFQWARNVVDWGIDSGLIITGDDRVDDWEAADLTYGTLWTLFHRMR